jgi:hypothetical protein
VGRQGVASGCRPLRAAMRLPRSPCETREAKNTSNHRRVPLFLLPWQHSDRLGRLPSATCAAWVSWCHGRAATVHRRSLDVRVPAFDGGWGSGLRERRAKGPQELRVAPARVTGSRSVAAGVCFQPGQGVTVSEPVYKRLALGQPRGKLTRHRRHVLRTPAWSI